MVRALARSSPSPGRSWLPLAAFDAVKACHIELLTGLTSRVAMCRFLIEKPDEGNRPSLLAGISWKPDARVSHGPTLVDSAPWVLLAHRLTQAPA